jgi:phage tail-like protein
MPEVTPYNPLLTFKFQIYFLDDPEPIVGVSKMGALKQKTTKVAYRSGGHARNSASQIPGGVEYEPVTFEQGLGLDDGRWEEWAFAANNWKNGQAGHQADAFRKNLRVNVLRLDGGVAKSYVLTDCWVSEYQALPELDANSMSTVGINTFTVELEGWYRDAV